MAMIYTFDIHKQLKKPIKATEYRHNEGMRTAIAEVKPEDAPENGEYFGFRCVDGKFRLFMITLRDVKDETGTCTLTGTDAAMAELNSRVVKSLTLKDQGAAWAAYNALEGTGWELVTDINPDMTAEDAYFTTVWEVLKTIAGAAGVRMDPYYEFRDGEITGRKVEMTEKTNVFRGLIYTRQKGARNIFITQEGVPYGRVFPVGKITGSEDPPTRLTIADAVWSSANGDPADKPNGQEYVDLPGAVTDAEYVYEDQRETDAKRLLEKAFEDLKEKQKPKAHGSANISDMEYLPGYEHRIVRLWDKAVIRTETGLTVETTIKNIDRYYVKKHLTKVTFGEEDEEDALIENQLAELNKTSAATARRLGGVGNGVGDNKQKIINAEELIQLNAQKIELNAEQINLRATKTEVLELEEGTRVAFNEVGIEMDALQAQITLKASQTQVDNLGNTVSQMNATLTVHAEEIEARVEKDGVISAINQTAESITIQAKRIDLSGYVTASQLKAEISDVVISFSNTIETGTMEANSAIIKAMEYNGKYCTWKSKTVQTSIPDFLKSNITLANGNSMSVVTGWADAPSNYRSTMYYLSHN